MRNMLENVIILSKSTSGFIGIIYIYIIMYLCGFLNVDTQTIFDGETTIK